MPLLIPYAFNWQTSDSKQSFDLTLKDSTSSRFATNPPQICMLDIFSVSEACALPFWPLERLLYTAKINTFCQPPHPPKINVLFLSFYSTQAGLFRFQSIFFDNVTPSTLRKSHTYLLILTFVFAAERKNAARVKPRTSLLAQHQETKDYSKWVTNPVYLQRKLEFMVKKKINLCKKK